MSKVTYNQRGYIGSSMSVRAHEAYEDGEMPKSKWTKKAMLEAIDAWCHDEDRVALPEVAKLKKDELFERCFCWTSWHHTGKYANATDFYGINEDAADAFSRPMDAEELAAAEAERRAEQERREAERARRQAEEEERRRAREAEKEAMKAEMERKLAALAPCCLYIAEIGHWMNPEFAADTMAADEALHPENYEVRISKKSGNVLIKNIHSGKELTVSEACRYRLSAW